MRIAQVSPLYERCPPQLYGGTERVVSYLTEELNRQGREVTLFASGDSVTNATLRAPVRPCAASRSSMQRSSAASPGDAEPRCADRRSLRHHPFSCGFSAFREFPMMPLVSISDAQRAPVPWASWQGTVHHGLPTDLYLAGRGDGGYLAFIGRISPEKRGGKGDQNCPPRRNPAENRGQGRQSGSCLLQCQDQKTAQGSGGGVHR